MIRSLLVLSLLAPSVCFGNVLEGKDNLISSLRDLVAGRYGDAHEVPSKQIVIDSDIVPSNYKPIALIPKHEEENQVLVEEPLVKYDWNECFNCTYNATSTLVNQTRDEIYKKCKETDCPYVRKLCENYIYKYKEGLRGWIVGKRHALEIGYAYCVGKDVCPADPHSNNTQSSFLLELDSESSQVSKEQWSLAKLLEQSSKVDKKTCPTLEHKPWHHKKHDDQDHHEHGDDAQLDPEMHKYVANLEEELLNDIMNPSKETPFSAMESVSNIFNRLSRKFVNAVSPNEHEPEHSEDDHDHDEDGDKHKGKHGHKCHHNKCKKCVGKSIKRQVIRSFKKVHCFCEKNSDCPAIAKVCGCLKNHKEFAVGLIMGATDPIKFAAGLCIGKGACDWKQIKPLMHMP